MPFISRCSNFDTTLTSGETEQETKTCLFGNEVENEEEELLRQAIALSLEEDQGES